jgi:hypothetical protein
MSPRKSRLALILSSAIVACLVTAATAVAGIGGTAHASGKATTHSVSSTPRTAPRFVTQFQAQHHRFEATNCGPASMTSVAKSLGAIAASESDFSAIEQLATIGHTSEGGTTIEGMGQIAKSLGLSFDWTWGTNPNAVAAKLREGKRIIAGGNMLALPWRAGAGVINHYIVIAGVTERGTFLAYDPMDYSAVAHELTASELTAFHMGSDRGGVTMAIDRVN